MLVRIDFAALHQVAEGLAPADSGDIVFEAHLVDFFGRGKLVDAGEAGGEILARRREDRVQAILPGVELDTCQVGNGAQEFRVIATDERLGFGKAGGLGGHGTTGEQGQH